MDVDFVADYLIAKGDKPNGECLTQLGLQKLVYLCQGWHLAMADELLFRENIYAFKLGPVVRELRDRFGMCGKDPLPPYPLTDAERVLSPSAKQIINGVWEQYAHLHSSRLVDLTHEAGSPWDQIWHHKSHGGTKGKIIPPTLIREWFKRELDEKLRPRKTPPRDLAGIFEKATRGL